jgi:hypothetical protein
MVLPEYNSRCCNYKILNISNLSMNMRQICSIRDQVQKFFYICRAKKCPKTSFIKTKDQLVTKSIQLTSRFTL